MRFIIVKLKNKAKRKKKETFSYLHIIIYLKRTICGSWSHDTSCPRSCVFFYAFSLFLKKKWPPTIVSRASCKHLSPRRSCTRVWREKPQTVTESKSHKPPIPHQDPHCWRITRQLVMGSICLPLKESAHGLIITLTWIQVSLPFNRVELLHL